jgi:hypothetical protein
MTDLSTAPNWRAQHGVAWLRNLNWSPTTNDLRLVLALATAWGLDLLVLAVFLHRRHAPAAYSLAGAVLVLLAAGIWLGLRRQIRITSPVLLTPMLVHGLLVAIAAWLVLAPGRGFAIDNYALYQVDPFPDGTARFAALSELPGGQTFLSPIDALVLLKVRNTASGQGAIQDYRIEAWTGAAWQPLCRVPFAPNPPYYLFTPTRAREIVLTPLVLRGPDGTIAPGQASTFWSAWSCPQKCDLAVRPKRLILTDANAHRTVIPFPSDQRTDGTALPSGMDIGGVLDLDVTKEKIYGRCADVSGARRGRAGALW